MIKDINHKGFGISELYGKLIEWVMEESKHLVSDMKSKASNRSFNWPYIIWISATIHKGYKDNDLRVKFNSSLNIAAKLRKELVNLPLKQVWDRQKSTTLHPSGEFTDQGAKMFWNALDRTIMYADMVIRKNPGKNIDDAFIAAAAATRSQDVTAKVDLNRKAEKDDDSTSDNNQDNDITRRVVMERAWLQEKAKRSKQNDSTKPDCSKRLF